MERSRSSRHDADPEAISSTWLVRAAVAELTVGVWEAIAPLLRLELGPPTSGAAVLIDGCDDLALRTVIDLGQATIPVDEALLRQWGRARSEVVALARAQSLAANVGKVQIAASGHGVLAATGADSLAGSIADLGTLVDETQAGAAVAVVADNALAIAAGIDGRAIGQDRRLELLFAVAARSGRPVLRYHSSTQLGIFKS